MTAALNSENLQRCPCCGGPASASDFQWIARDQVLTGRGKTVAFSLREGQIFDVLWRARNEHYALSTIEIAARAFANLEGPEWELDCVKVYRFKLRKKLKSIGLEIREIGASALPTGPGSQRTYRLVDATKREPARVAIKTRPESPNIIVGRTRKFGSLET